MNGALPRAARVGLRLLALAGLVLAGCSAASDPPKPARPSRAAYTPESGLPGAVQIAWRLPRAAPGSPPSSAGSDEEFFDLPWPSELSRLPSGVPDWSRFPGQDSSIVERYVEAAETEELGFSLATSIYFHFTEGGAPDPGRFVIKPAKTLTPASPVALVNVDPASPHRGELTPVELRYYEAEIHGVPARTLAVKPVPGFVLRPGTLHAAVVRRDLGGAKELLGTSRDLEMVKWTRPRQDPDEERARRMHEAAFDALAGVGIGRDAVGAIALFRTGRPHALFEQMVDVVGRLAPADSARIVRAQWAPNYDSEELHLHSSYFTLQGEYCTPNFQLEIGKAPFLADGGGGIARDERGRPAVVPLPEGSPYRTAACGGLLHARFVLTVPRAQMPKEGFPLMVTAHGTTGDAFTFVHENDFAGWAALEGIAVVSTDQPLHGARGGGRGARPGSREPPVVSLMGLRLPVGLRGGAELTFYNGINARALLGNLRQAAIDGVVLARLFASANFANLLGETNQLMLAPSPDRSSPRFDARRLLLAGHSQGSQSMAAQGAVDPMVRGVLLSGCGGDARLGVLRRRDLEFMPLFEALLGFSTGELDEFHPLMTLVQTLADPIDPASYGRFYAEPLPGRRPRSVLHFEGVTDTYTPAETGEALAVALRATPLAPTLRTVDGLTILGLLPESGALRGNAAQGQATIAFVQLASTQGENGHFVLYHEPEAAELTRQFFRGVVSGSSPAEVGPIRAR